MKKKCLSLMLVLALVLSLCPWAMAAETRETDFFEDQPHTELSFDEIEYKHIEAEPILAAMNEIRGLMDDAANEDVVSEKFDAVTDQLMELITMYSIANIRSYQDVTSETYAEEEAYTYSIYLTVYDEFALLVRDLLASPCAAFIKEQLTEEDLAYYLSYEAMTEEDAALYNQEQALEQEYNTAAIQAFTVEYEGEAYDEDALYEAYFSGVMDYDTMNTLMTEIVKKQNTVLGEIYLRMVAVRNKIAKAAGYSNYGDYAYAEVYGRDYTQQEIRAFHQAVKDYIVPVYDTFYSLYYYQSGDPAFYEDYTGDIAVDMVGPYVGQMSSELAESFHYMCDHGMYDLEYSDTKAGVGFTTMLYSFGAPFMFNQPYYDLYDFTTLVHEFGHYNNYYWDSTAWNAASDNIDTAEVHSQGMELLFSHYYPQVFGDSADAVLDYQVMNLTSAIIQGCMHDELQQYVYATPNVTLKQINAKYIQLLKDYGYAEEDDPRTEAYGWVTIPHTFESPMYYISYAVSASGAFAFWLDAQEGTYTDTVDKYLEFVALPPETGFQDSFAAGGVDNPISAQYIQELAGELMTATGAEERLPSVMLSSFFTDLKGSHWFDEYVLTLVMYGMIEGYEDGTFREAASVTWGQALKLVLLLATGEEAAPLEGGHWASGYQAQALEWELLEDEVDLDSAITRQELCQLLAMTLGLEESESASPFTDTEDGYVLALVDLGVINGFAADDGTYYFSGESSLTRSQLCKILYYTIDILTAEDAAA